MDHSSHAISPAKVDNKQQVIPISEQSSPKHSSGQNSEVEKDEAILDLV